MIYAIVCFIGLAMFIFGMPITARNLSVREIRLRGRCFSLGIALFFASPIIYAIRGCI